MMTDKELKHIVRTCTIRHDFMEHKRNLNEVICRDHCLPCLRVIELGKCTRIKEYINDSRRD